MSGRAMVWDSVEGSSSVDLISDGACSYGNSNTITNSPNSIALGVGNTITDSANAAILGSYTSSITNSPFSCVVGGGAASILNQTGTKVILSGNYVDLPFAANLRMTNYNSLTTAPNILSLPSCAGVPTGTVDSNGITIPEGSICWDSSGNKCYVYNGASWDIFHTGGIETLSATLGAGNTSGANNIIMNSGQSIRMVGSSTGQTVITTSQSGVTDRTVTFPSISSNDTFALINAVQTLSFKTLSSPTISGGTINSASIGATTASTGRFTTVTATNTTNQVVLGTTNTVTITSPAPAASRTHTIPIAVANDTFVLNNTQATTSNKTMLDQTTLFAQTIDQTKLMKFDLSFCNTATTTNILIAPGTSTSGFLSTADGVLSLTNKNITNPNNTVYSEALFCAAKASSVSVSASAAPTAGQTLVASSGTVASWGYPTIPYLAVGVNGPLVQAVTAGVPVDITGMTVTCTVAGTYKFDWSTSFVISVANGHVTFFYAINGVAVTNSERHIESDGPGKDEPAHSGCLIALAVGNVVTMRMTSDSTGNITNGNQTMIGTRVSA